MLYKGKYFCSGFCFLGSEAQIVMLKLSFTGANVNLFVLYNPVSRLLDLCLVDLTKLLNQCNGAYSVIIGDFNLDLLKDNVKPSSYLNFMSQYGFCPVNNDCTRPASGIVIDNVLVNFPKEYIDVFTVQGDLSDRNLLVCYLRKFDTLSHREQRELRVVHDFNNASKLTSDSLRNYSHGENVEALSALTRNLVTDALVSTADTRTFIRKKEKLNPWSTPELGRLVNVKKSLYRKLKGAPGNILLQQDLDYVVRQVNILRKKLKKSTLVNKSSIR